MLSSHIRQSELLDYNISVVDPLEKSRKEHPDAVYLISPITSSVQRVIDDLQRPKPMYDNVWIYTTSKMPEKLLTMIKSCTPLLNRLQALKEVRPAAGCNLCPVYMVQWKHAHRAHSTMESCALMYVDV